MLSTIRNLFHRSAPQNPGATVTLAEVLAHDWLELWYQPKVELRSKHLAGAEALARARHPKLGLLNPGQFLPGASEADMLALTERVIHIALRDWEDFAYYDMPIAISVNTPVSALTTLPIADIIRKERPKSASWPGLILEVTEDEVISDVALANEVADAVHACHCKLALDDFGAGFSSIARLTQLPFDELKIDRSQVANCDSDRVNGGLCEVIVELGQRFGLKTVAEGIETWADFLTVREMGFDLYRASCSPSQ